MGVDDGSDQEASAPGLAIDRRLNHDLSPLSSTGLRPRGAAAARTQIPGNHRPDLQNSTPDKIPLITAPAGAPNVLFIMIDDAGFGDWSTFGGQIPTPNLDALAHQGLSYTRFHTTALCSPTRAALLTGRNHHSAGTGVITELGSGYPGYSGQIPKSEAMISEMLRQNGYSTAFFGKNHNIPDWETSVSGPVRSLADHAGLRSFLRLHRRRGQSVAAGALRGQQAGRDGSAEGPREGLHAKRESGRQGDRIHPPGKVGDARPAVLHLLRARRHARAASRSASLDRQVQGPVRPGLGQVSRRDVSAPVEDGHHSGRHQADASACRNSGVGFFDRRSEESVDPPDGNLRRVHRPDGSRGRPRDRLHPRHRADSTTR